MLILPLVVAALAVPGIASAADALYGGDGAGLLYGEAGNVEITVEATLS